MPAPRCVASANAVSTATGRRRARPSINMARFIGCGARRRWPRIVIAPRAAEDAIRNRDWHCCGSRRGAPMHRPPPFAGWWARPASAPPAAGFCRRTSRSCWPSAISRRHNALARSSRRCARVFETEVVHAQAAQARGALCVRSGEAQAALGYLRESFQRWERLEAPYEAARVRVTHCRSLRSAGRRGSERARARCGAFHLRAARREVRSRAARCRAEGRGPAPAGSVRASCRCCEHIARGRTNKWIARELGLSARTIDRHVSNILIKLQVPSRAAAAVYASAHHLF